MAFFGLYTYFSRRTLLATHDTEKQRISTHLYDFHVSTRKRLSFYNIFTVRVRSSFDSGRYCFHPGRGSKTGLPNARYDNVERGCNTLRRKLEKFGRWAKDEFLEYTTL